MGNHHSDRRRCPGKQSPKGAKHCADVGVRNDFNLNVVEISVFFFFCLDLLIDQSSLLTLNVMFRPSALVPASAPASVVAAGRCAAVRASAVALATDWSVASHASHSCQHRGRMSDFLFFVGRLSKRCSLNARGES